MNDIEEPIEEKYTPSKVTDINILDKLDNASKVYPVWNPEEKGEIVEGIIEHVEFMQHLNDGKGNYLLRLVSTNGTKFVVFPNVVMQKKLLQLTPNNDMNQVLGKKVFMRYEGKIQPQDNRKKEYSTYTVIEGN